MELPQVQQQQSQQQQPPQQPSQTSMLLQPAQPKNHFQKAYEHFREYKDAGTSINFDV
jgi:hypothetical protein